MIDLKKLSKKISGSTYSLKNYIERLRNERLARKKELSKMRRMFLHDPNIFDIFTPRRNVESNHTPTKEY